MLSKNYHKLLGNILSSFELSPKIYRNTSDVNVANVLDTSICSIGYENYVNGCEYVILDCKHIFHYVCIKKWIKQINNCPLCKKNLK